MDVFQFLPEIANAPDDRVEIPLLPNRTMDPAPACDLKTRLALEIPHDADEILVMRIKQQM